MAKPAVFVTDKLPMEAKALLSEWEVFESEATEAELARCVGLLAWPSRAKRDLLHKMPRLKAFQTMTAGVDEIDFDALPAGTVVLSNAGAYTDSVAEHAWGLLLGVAKGVHARRKKVPPIMLKGKTLLVVGCGGIGSEVARLSKSIGMKTVGVSRSFRVPGVFDERHPSEALGSAMPRADAVVIALPLTLRTRGLIGLGVLMKARDTVCMVNVGRGETVQEDALVEWLKRRPDSRFATDVFWKKNGRETFDTDAWDAPNFAGTLHLSGAPRGEGLERQKIAAAGNLVKYLERGKAENIVDSSEYRSVSSKLRP